MMKTKKIHLLVCTLFLSLFNCKNNQTSFTDFQYADKPQKITCNDVDTKLLNEALYTFEKDIIDQFSGKQPNLIRAYNTYMKRVTRSTKPVDYTKFASKHAVDVAKALQQTNLYNNGTFNYNAPTISCLASNMKKADIATTFNALLNTNSLSKKLFGPALAENSSKVAQDVNLALFVALDYFYNDIMKQDFSKVNFENRNENENKNTAPVKIQQNQTVNPNQKVDFNQTPR